MAAAAPVGELLLESLRFPTRPGAYLPRGKYANCGVDLVGVELGPVRKGHGAEPESE